MLTHTVSLFLDRARGRLVITDTCCATVHLDDAGDLPRECARLALYTAVLDGRCPVPSDVYRSLKLDSAQPRIIKPNAS